jgi:hypothetical protein
VQAEYLNQVDRLKTLLIEEEEFQRTQRLIWRADGQAGILESEERSSYYDPLDVFILAFMIDPFLGIHRNRTQNALEIYDTYFIPKTFNPWNEQGRYMRKIDLFDRTSLNASTRFAVYPMNLAPYIYDLMTVEMVEHYYTPKPLE